MLERVGVWRDHKRKCAQWINLDRYLTLRSHGNGRIFDCIAENFDRTLRSHWTVQFFRSVHSKLQGWRSVESTRLPPMWPGFKSRRWRHMWVEFVVGSLPCSERFFLRYSGFLLHSKTNTSKFQFDLERTDTFKRDLKNSWVFHG